MKNISLSEAFDHLKNQRNVEALSFLRRFVVIVPENLDVTHYLGAALSRLNQSVAAIAMLRRCVHLAPMDANMRANLARTAQHTGHFEIAESAWRTRLMFDPTEPEALSALGCLLQTDGRLDEAISLLRRAAAVQPQDDGGVPRARAEAHQQLARKARQANLPEGLVVRGAFREGTGYGHATRQFVRGMVEAGIRVHLIDRMSKATESGAPPLDPFFEKLDQPVRAKAALSFTTPIEVEKLPGLKTVNYTFFEAQQIPDLWARHSRRHDHVLVATESCRAAWLAAGHPVDRISICPLGVASLDRSQVAPLGLPDPRGGWVTDRRLRFLNISALVSRKNTQSLLRTWLRTTKASDDCALLLKLGSSPDDVPIVRAMATECVNAVGVPLTEAAPIFTIANQFSDEQMLSLMACGTHYWSMSHGEGWDLPMAQAAALGLTPVAPEHSAYLAYLTPETAHFLPCAVTKADGAYEGLSWWTPDEDEAERRLRRMIDSPDGERRSAQTMLRRDFDWRRSTRRLIETLERVGAL